MIAIPTIVGMIAVVFRFTYYFGLVFLNFDRGVALNYLIAIPSPFLWLSITVLNLSHFMEIRERGYLKTKLKELAKEMIL